MRKALIITGTILLSLFIAAIVFCMLLFWMPKGTKQAQSTQVIDKFLHVTGNQVISLSGNDLSSLASDLAEKGLHQNSCQISYINADISGKYLTFYMSVIYKKVNLFITVQGTPSINDSLLKFKLNKIYIGKVRIPVNLAERFLKQKVNKIKMADNGVVQINIEGESLPFKISSMYIDKDKLNLSIKSTVNNEIFSELQQIKKANTKGIENPHSALTTNNNSANNSGTVQNSNTHPDVQISDAEKKIKASLATASSQLSDAYNAIKDTNERNVISMIKNTVDNLCSNINYDYTKDAQNAKNDYNNLSADEKKDLKSKLLANVDLKNISFLRSAFGI